MNGIIAKLNNRHNIIGGMRRIRDEVKKENNKTNELLVEIMLSKYSVLLP